MISIPGYTVTRTMYEGATSTVYRGQREQDRTPVILKTLSKAYPTPQEMAQFVYGYEMTKNLDIAGVVKPYGLETCDSKLVLVLEDFGGDALKTVMDAKEMALLEVLKIALQLSKTLGELHQQQIIHQDIMPANIIINPAGLVKITDFGIASRLTRETPEITSPDRLEGTLAYMSPEQTGRMNRAVDYRTDFYSLGVTLYEMLTRRLPFQATDPMELVHCHIAIRPQRPDAVRPEIPKVVADLVMKLLAKTAEERYQSAYALTTDLETCVAQLQSSGQIGEMSLGEADVSSSLQMPQKLYGREGETAVLMDAFQRVSRGTTEMMLVCGYSGVGKSALVHEIHRPIVQQRGYFISGKFNQLQNVPYAALIQAFRGLVGQLLTESSARLAAWKEQLLEALGAVGQVINDVIPEVELIIGKQPAVPQLGPTESQNRFNLVFQNFMGVFAQEGHPLVVFLDDLQWADSASLKLIQLLSTDADRHYLLLIGAYRDNEVSAAHPLLLTLAAIQKTAAPVHSISLSPLNLLTVNQFIADALHCALDRAQPLAALVHQKTGGNPFFLNQFLQALDAEGWLHFDASRGVWQWDVQHIQELGITDNVAHLMSNKIRKLSEQTQHVLQLAACIGNTFDLDTLSVVNGTTPVRTAAELWEALREGLILPLGNAYKYLSEVGEPSRRDMAGAAPAPADSRDFTVAYSFLHDRVQEAAYALIPEEAKKQTHLQVGQLLLKNTPPEEREDNIFDIVNQLNISTDFITDADERHELARLNLIAGRKAKAATAYAAALEYCTVGTALLAENSWQTEHDMTFALYRQRAECAHLCGHFDTAEDLFAILLDAAQSHLEKAEVYNLRIALYNNMGRYPEALEVGLAGLRQFGLAIPETAEGLQAALQAELRQVPVNLGGRRIRQVIDAPEMTDADTMANISLLAACTVPAYVLDLNLFCLVETKIVNLSLQYGNAPQSDVGYVMYSGPVLCGAFPDFQSAYEFGQLALALNEKLHNFDSKAKLHLVFGGFVNNWRRHIASSLPHLDTGYLAGLEAGDFVWASYCAMQTVWQRFIKGDELDGLYKDSLKYLDFLRVNQHYDVMHVINFFQNFILHLRGLVYDKQIMGHEILDESTCLEKMQETHWYLGITGYYVFKTQVLVIDGNYAEALKMALEVPKTIAGARGHITEAEFLFFSSLAITGLYATATPEEKAHYWQTLTANQTALQVRAESCPPNFLHKYLLVAAEMARLANQDAAAMELYDQAIASAGEHAFTHNEALANELAAQFFLARGRHKIARVYLMEARYGYLKWGADAKVRALDATYPQLLAQASSGTERSAVASLTTWLDLTTVMKASQAISGEIVLGALLKRVMQILLENAGAQKGFLMLDNATGDLCIEAGGAVDQTDIMVLPSTPVESSQDLSLAAINYVQRTGNNIVLGDARYADILQSDPYVIQHQPKSILCMPIIRQRKRIGILYLENNLATDAFTSDRLEVLEILAAQAAISIENANLYSNLEAAHAQLEDYNRTLERRVAERTQELRGKNTELEQTLHQLQETQEHLISQERLASLGMLSAGIAHEIKNPLNFVNNFAAMSIEFTQELRREIDAQKDRLERQPVEDIAAIITDLEQNVRRINEHGSRANAIINSMLLHVRGGTGNWQWTDINAALQQYTDLAYHAMRAGDGSFHLTINTDYDDAIGLVNVVPQDLGRVLLNVINNACYAAHEQKKALGEWFSPTLTIRTKKLGERVEIRIRDNGKGIPQAIRDKVFEPFFTTKPPGEGTGLGLYISYNIVREHKGEITVDTEEGQGTEFIITLPKEGVAGHMT